MTTEHHISPAQKHTLTSTTTQRSEAPSLETEQATAQPEQIGQLEQLHQPQQHSTMRQFQQTHGNHAVQRWLDQTPIARSPGAAAAIPQHMAASSNQTRQKYPTGSTKVEERQLRDPAVVKEQAALQLFQQVISAFSAAFDQAIAAKQSHAALQQIVATYGTQLWSQATARAATSPAAQPAAQPAPQTTAPAAAQTTTQPAPQTKAPAAAQATTQPAPQATATQAVDLLDDRPLYWARLQMAQKIRGALSSDRTALQGLLDTLDESSRGRTTATFVATNVKRILVSGFDPFGGTATSNPSGSAALALDGQVLAGANGQQAEIQSVVFPVRFGDFDAGTIEKFFGPYLQGPAAVDMIVTMSMDDGNVFNLDRFVGRYRNPRHRDNADRRGGKADFGVPRDQQPEFLESTLPINEIRGRLGNTTPLVNDDGAVVTKEQQQPFTATSLQALNGQTARQGAGGDFLSNEISYRTLLLRSRVNENAKQTGQAEKNIPVGHLHVPYLDPSTDMAPRRAEIISRIREILQAALPSLYTNP
ncbi:MAG: hypothetical protein JOZ51_17215 [Chloroflexi bacterium]|nr:hypothetical protein [Chloroflexota bacterium]